MPKLLRSLTAEFVGTLLFVFLGAGSVVAFIANGPTTGSIGPLGVALAHGVGMAVIVSMTMSISGGHINPAVTLGLWLGERFEGRRVGPYILAQILGAVAGAALVKAVFPPMAVGLALVGTPRLATEVGFMQGVWIEALLTFFLARASSSMPRAAAALIIAYSPLTWYAASGEPNSCLARRIRSKHGSAGFTRTMSAPSSTSSPISRIASSALVPCI